MDIVALIGTVAGVAGTGVAVVAARIAYLQLRVERSGGAPKEQADQLAQLVGEPALFTPQARYLGFDVDLIDRHEESARLLRGVRAKSVICIEGMPGCGKTSLAAHVCRHVGRGWD